MAVARTKRVIRRDWTRDDVKELRSTQKTKPGEDSLQSHEAHARGLKTKGLCARNFARPPHKRK